jgi:hypothetical protein
MATRVSAPLVRTDSQRLVEDTPSKETRKKKRDDDDQDARAPPPFSPTVVFHMPPPRTRATSAVRVPMEDIKASIYSSPQMDSNGVRTPAENVTVLARYQEDTDPARPHQPLYLLFVVDASGSMDAAMQQTRDSVKKQIRMIDTGIGVDGKDPPKREVFVCIMKFAVYCTVLTTGVHADEHGFIPLHKAGAESLLLEAVDKIDTAGGNGTNLHLAMATASNTLVEGMETWVTQQQHPTKPDHADEDASSGGTSASKRVCLESTAMESDKTSDGGKDVTTSEMEVVHPTNRNVHGMVCLLTDGDPNMGDLRNGGSIRAAVHDDYVHNYAISWTAVVLGTHVNRDVANSLLQGDRFGFATDASKLSSALENVARGFDDRLRNVTIGVCCQDWKAEANADHVKHGSLATGDVLSSITHIPFSHLSDNGSETSPTQCNIQARVYAGRVSANSMCWKTGPTSEGDSVVVHQPTDTDENGTDTQTHPLIASEMALMAAREQVVTAIESSAAVGVRVAIGNVVDIVNAAVATQSLLPAAVSDLRSFSQVAEESLLRNERSIEEDDVDVDGPPLPVYRGGIGSRQSFGAVDRQATADLLAEQVMSQSFRNHY